jgi:LPS-assembly protein
MNLILKLIFLIPLVFTLTGEICAQESSPPNSKISTSQNNASIRISADHIIQGTKKGSVLAWGRVKVQHKNQTLWADKVLINNKTGIGKARGHIILESEDGSRTKAKETLFDLKSKRGKLYESKTVLSNQVRLTAKKIANLSASHLVLDDATLTTCKGALPAWQIEAKSIDIKAGNRALFTNAVLKIKDFPVLYMPIGYIPMDTKRKSGFLFPTLGWSKIDGVLFDQRYFWAINRWSDATIGTKRVLGGWQHSLDYRYIRSKNAQGMIGGKFYKDNLTGSTLWKGKAKHTQELPNKFKFKGFLDLESQQSLNRVVNNNVEERTRRNTESYASVNKRWENSSIDILTRYRETTDFTQDDTLGELPKITYKVQQTQIGDTPFYFNLDTSSAWFVTDLKTQKEEDFMFKTSRLDFHPQLTVPLALTPWLSMTSIIGARETIYGRGLTTTNSEYKKTSGFTRESFDFRSIIQGPKINKVYHLKNSPEKIKHLLEPRLTFNYVPDMDQKDRLKIRTFDSIDTIGNAANSITYEFGQRLLKKIKTGASRFETKQILRFNISQTYNIREATRKKQLGEERLPFSDLFFDFDSRPLESIIVNTDASYNFKTDLINSFNFEAGVKPVENFWIIMERRWTRGGPSYIVGTLDLALKPNWRAQYSARYDESVSTFRENQFSLLYDNPCKCWGFSFDIIDRNLNVATNERKDQTQFLWSIKLRGLGDFGLRDKGKFLHRDFEETSFPSTIN